MKCIYTKPSFNSFLSCIQNNIVKVYKLKPKAEVSKNTYPFYKKSNYNILVNEFIVKNIYFGKNRHGRIWTILLELPNNQLVFIGSRIFSFSLEKNDKIENYWSHSIADKDYPQSIILTNNVTNKVI